MPVTGGDYRWMNLMMRKPRGLVRAAVRAAQGAGGMLLKREYASAGQALAAGLIIAARRLGVTVERLDDQLAEYFGVKDGLLVKSVQLDSAAQKAGIKAGDVITGLNGANVYDASDLNRAIERIAETGEFTTTLALQ